MRRHTRNGIGSANDEAVGLPSHLKPSPLLRGCENNYIIREEHEHEREFGLYIDDGTEKSNPRKGNHGVRVCAIRAVESGGSRRLAWKHNT